MKAQQGLVLTTQGTLPAAEQSISVAHATRRSTAQRVVARMTKPIRTPAWLPSRQTTAKTVGVGSRLGIACDRMLQARISRTRSSTTRLSWTRAIARADARVTSIFRTRPAVTSIGTASASQNGARRRRRLPAGGNSAYRFRATNRRTSPQPVQTRQTTCRALVGGAEAWSGT